MAECIFHVNPVGNLGNRMIQFLVARKIAARIPGCQISNVALSEWKINYPLLELSGYVHRHRDEQFVYPVTFERLYREGGVSCISYSGYGQRVENFPDYRAASAEFVAEGFTGVGYDAQHLVINVRGGEVLDGRHPHYVLVPIDFYRDLVKRTGLTPVFMGQIEDNKYTRALCSAFPDATFVPSRGALADFETLRQSTNVVPAVSTFSWLACWLSTTARNIFMPLTGLFNPLYNSHHDFAPADDNRFHFFLFPANFSSHVESYEPNHAALAGRYEQIEREKLAYLKRKRRGIQRDRDRHVALFDEDYYVKKYSDVRQALSNGLLSGLLHYVNSGFNERRDGFAFDHDHYVRAYPQAARELGYGEFEGPRHHYADVGSLRGYRATPE